MSEIFLDQIEERGILKGESRKLIELVCKKWQREKYQR